MSDIQLTYKSSTLRLSDISLFYPSNWLNDQCINFYFEYLNSPQKPSLVFVDPAATFLMIFENDLEDLLKALSSLELSTKEFIFCPVNDSKDPTNPLGGSHWSLLVYSTVLQESFYYDSLYSTINPNAGIINQQLNLVLNHNNQVTQVYLENAQNNSADCGVYVLLIAETLADNLTNSRDQLLLRGLQSLISPSSASQLRTRILEVIKSLKIN